MTARRPSTVDTALLDSVPDGILLCDSRGRIVYASRQLETMTGFAHDALAGRAVETLVPEALRVRHKQDRARYQARPRRRRMGLADRDFEVRRADGSTFAADIALGPVALGDERYVMAVIRDVTARKKLEAELAHRALHDPLTGLANRTLFFDRLGQALLRARREREQVGLVLLDLDRFKSVNDVHGHQVGDSVLRKIASGLASGLRSTDTVARIGGDEFAWVLPSVNGRQAATVMLAKLIRAIPATVVVDRKTIDVGVSAGLAIYPDDGHDIDGLIRAADLELYAAKRQIPVVIRRRAGKR